MHVLVPGPLRSYTNDAAKVSADGATLAEVVGDLELRYPGIRFRIIDEQGKVRPHVKLFVGTDATRDLSSPIPSGATLMIVAALSGG